MMGFGISKISDVLVSQSALNNCSFKEAWENHMYPLLKEQATFEEVEKYINDKISSTEQALLEFKKDNGYDFLDTVNNKEIRMKHQANQTQKKNYDDDAFLDECSKYQGTMDTKVIELKYGDFYILIGILNELVKKGELKILDDDVQQKIANIIKSLWKSGS